MRIYQLSEQLFGLGMPGEWSKATIKRVKAKGAGGRGRPRYVPYRAQRIPSTATPSAVAYTLAEKLWDMVNDVQPAS